MTDKNKTRSVRGILRLFFQHWGLMALIIATGTVGTVLYCQFIANWVYQSKVSLIVQRPSKGNGAEADGVASTEGFMNAQKELVLSDLVLARTIAIAEDNALSQKWTELRKQWETSKGIEKKDSIAFSRVNRFLNENPNDPTLVAQHVNKLLKERQSDVQSLRTSIQVDGHGGNQGAGVLTLTVMRPSRRSQADSYQDAKRYADILADMYVVRYEEIQSQLDNPATHFAQDTLDSFEKTMREHQTRYDTFVAENGADIGMLDQLLRTGGESSSQIVTNKVRESDADLNLSLTRDRAFHNVVTQAIPAKAFESGGIASMTEAEISDALDHVSNDYLTSTSVLKDGVNNLTQLETKKANLQSQFQDESYEIKHIRYEIAEAKRHLLASVVSSVKGLAASIAAREQQTAMNKELLQARAAEQTQINKKLAEYTRLKSEFQVAQQHFDDLTKQKMTAVASAGGSAWATIHRLDEASMPSRNNPVSPQLASYALIGFGISVLLVVLLAIFFKVFDHTMHFSVDAERHVGLPVLGSVRKYGHSLVEAA